MPDFDDARDVPTVSMWDDKPEPPVTTMSPQEYYDQYFRDKDKKTEETPEAPVDPVEDLLKKSAKVTGRSNPDDVVGRPAKP